MAATRTTAAPPKQYQPAGRATAEKAASSHHIICSLLHLRGLLREAACGSMHSTAADILVVVLILAPTLFRLVLIL